MKEDKENTSSQVRTFSNGDFQALRKSLEQAPAKIRLVSNSMAPLMPTGTQAQIAYSTFDKLKRFDIVVFWEDGRFICHLVFGVGALPAANGERVLVTRGLASRNFDFPVRESQILGRVTSHHLGFYHRTRLILRALARRVFS